MAKYTSVGKGAAFIREKTKDSQPDFNGTMTINDEQYSISLWKSRSKKGDRYLSIQVSIKEEDEDSFNYGENK